MFGQEACSHDLSPYMLGPVLAKHHNIYFGKISKIKSVIDHTRDFLSPPTEEELENNSIIKSFKDKQIIQDILQKRKLQMTDALLVMDWDNTLSMLNGSSLPLREKTDTRQTLEYFAELGIPIIILTSRLQGAPAFIQDENQAKPDPNVFDQMVSSVNNMMSALNIKLSPAFKESAYNYIYPPSNLKFGQYPSPDHPTYYTIIHHNVVFAGMPNQSIKGPGLVDLIDQQLFIHDPKLIIFVDNDLDHVESILTAFDERPEKVIGLYYPQTEQETKDTISLLTP